jgi:hypothetical protein
MACPGTASTARITKMPTKPAVDCASVRYITFSTSAKPSPARVA